MNQITQKIEERKRTIHQKKQDLRHDVDNLKRRLGAPAGLSLTTVGGLLVGFMLLPKKYKLMKFILKAATVVSTARQLLELIPHQTRTRRRNHALPSSNKNHRKSNVTSIHIKKRH